MITQADFYRSAKIVLAIHGDKAIDHVLSKILYHLSILDEQGAGMWLAIGQAIEVLTDVTPAGPVH